MTNSIDPTPIDSTTRFFARSSIFKRRLAAAIVIASSALLLSLDAVATPIVVGGAGGPAMLIDPIYFKGFDQFGLVGPGTGPAYRASSGVSFLSVGNQPGVTLSLTQQLLKPIQHPQDPANSQNPLTNGGTPTAPTDALPFVADSNWTITNTSGGPLADVLLLFTKVTGATGYPAVDVALDDAVFDTLQYDSSTAGTLYFGALQLGSLGPGEQAHVKVRYVVADPLLFGGTDFVMPPFGLSALARGSYVPEPATAALLAAGLVILRSRRRAGG